MGLRVCTLVAANDVALVASSAFRAARVDGSAHERRAANSDASYTNSKRTYSSKNRKNIEDKDECSYSKKLGSKMGQ